MPTVKHPPPQSNHRSAFARARAALVRRDGYTRRLQRVRPGRGVFADTHKPKPGAHAGTVAWQSRRAYLSVTLPAVLRTPRGRAALAAHEVNGDTFLRWAEVESQYAETANGRGVHVRPDTVGRRMGDVSERQVQRCRAAALELELVVVILPGRRLTLAEAAWGRGHEGGHIAGFSTVTAFVVPRWAAVLGSPSPLPQVARAPAGSVSAVCGTGGPSGVARRGEAEPTSSAAAAEKQRGPRKRGRPSMTGADRAALALARGLIAETPWLTGASPWRLRQTLVRFARAGWTARDLVDAIDATQTRMGWSTPARDAVRRPWAFLARYLRDLDVQADHPRPDLLHLRESARPWCGKCDPRTRWRGLDRPRRCPDCHPHTQPES